MKWLIVFVLTLFVSLVAATFLYVFGLILVEFLLIPVALGVTALLAALTAVYLGNAIVDDGLRTPVREVVRGSEWTAFGLALALVLIYFFDLLPAPAIYRSAASGSVLAAAAVIFARRTRLPPGEVASEGRRVVLWLVIAVLALPVVILIASFFGLAGA